MHINFNFFVKSKHWIDYENLPNLYKLYTVVSTHGGRKNLKNTYV